ncbi:MAG: cation transporter [Lysinibacillus sp.]
MTVITLNVEGMSCGNCVNSIESNLRQLSGVEEVQVELAAKTVTVTASTASEKQIADVIEDLGFDVV